MSDAVRTGRVQAHHRWVTHMAALLRACSAAT